MLQIITALWPVFALLLLGYAARRLRFPGEAFWPLLERTIYYVFFPVLLVDRLAQADMDGLPVERVALAVIGLILAGTLMSFGVKRWLGLGHAGFTSFYQGSVRFNTYVGLAAVAALFDDTSLAIAAVVIAVMIPLLNVACVLVFSLERGRSPDLGALARNIALNPLILACLLGVALNVSGWGLPLAIASMTELLSRVALPMGLLAVGAGLSFRAALGARRAVLGSSLLKLLLMPVAAVGVSLALGLSAEVVQVMVLFAALPTAPSSYILARQMGGDAPAMAAIITAQTLLSMLSLPAVLLIYGNFF